MHINPKREVCCVYVEGNIDKRCHVCELFKRSPLAFNSLVQEVEASRSPLIRSFGVYFHEQFFATSEYLT